MAQYLSEVIKGWLGWCPDPAIVTLRKKASGPEMNSCVPREPGTYVNDNVIVNHGKTGISLTRFFGILIAIIGSIALWILVIRSGFLPHARILVWALALPFLIVMVYQDIRKAHLEISPDTLIIRRILHRPVIIPKDTISSIEIRPNEQPFPLRLQKILIIILSLIYAGMVWVQYLQVVAGEITVSSYVLNLGVDLGIILFLLVLYYHSRIRADYPELLVITTNTQKRVVIFGKNPEEIAQKLGKSV